MPNIQPDFSGWATVYDRRCTDGRTIKRGAFDDMDGQRVPLVWQHQHDDPENVLGYAILHSDKCGRGMRCDGYFNDTSKAESAKSILAHGDIDSLSIYANHLTENSRKEVSHGTIKEVSLVMFGANADARIDYTSLHHADMSLEELYSDAIIYNGVHFAHEDDDDGDDFSIDDIDWDNLTDEELDELEDILDEYDALHHADEDDEDFGIKTSQDLIDAYSRLPENEMDMINRFLAHLGKGEQVPQNEIDSVSAMIESKDKPTQVALLTMLSIAAEG